jgi:hypothetical protein
VGDNTHAVIYYDRAETVLGHGRGINRQLARDGQHGRGSKKASGANPGGCEVASTAEAGFNRNPGSPNGTRIEQSPAQIIPMAMYIASCCKAVAAHNTAAFSG